MGVEGRGTQNEECQGASTAQNRSVLPSLNPFIHSFQSTCFSLAPLGPNFLSATPSRTRSSWARDRHILRRRREGCAPQFPTEMPQASGRGLLIFEYLSIQVRACGKCLYRKEMDTALGPQRTPNSLSLPKLTLELAPDTLTGSDRLRLVP